MGDAETEWAEGLDELLPKLATGHWDARTTRLQFFQLFARMFYGKKWAAQAVRWLTGRIDELLAAGDVRTVERLRHQLRWADVLDSQEPGATKLWAKLDGAAAIEKTEYAFRREGSYLLADIERLPAAEKKQFLAAAKSYLGKAFKTPAAFFTALGRELEEKPDEIEAVRWRIARKAKPKVPVYEMWTFLVDNGSVFEIGKAAPIGVQARQGSFSASVAAHRALAEDLERTAPF